MWTKWFRLLVIAILLVGVITPQTANATSIWTVCPSGCSFTSIQAAVDSAGAGDEIHVAEGTYSGVISRPSPAGYVGGTGTISQVVYIDKPLAIMGGYSSDFTQHDPSVYTTMIDAQNLGRGLFIWGDGEDITVEGVTIINGNAADQGGASSSYDVGGAIASFYENLTLVDSVVKNSTSTVGMGKGGGVCFSYGSLIIRNSMVSGNIANYGGGIYSTNADSTIIQDSQILNNTAFYGSGITISGQLDVENNIFRGNYGGIGGGLYIFYGTGLVLGNLFEGNELANRTSHYEARLGSAALFEQSTILFQGNILRNNIVHLIPNWVSNEGALNVYKGAFTGVNNVVSANVGTQVVFNMTGVPVASLENDTIIGKGDAMSAGVLVLGGGVEIQNSIVVSNTIGISVTLGATVSLNSTLWWGNGVDWSGEGVVNHQNDFFGNPEFNADGYHIGVGSPAIDVGVDDGVYTDIDNQGRPMGAGYDLGADEFFVAIPTMTPTSTKTPTSTPTQTPTPSDTSTPTQTPTPSTTPTGTASSTVTASQTLTPTPTSTPTQTQTQAPKVFCVFLPLVINR